MKVRMSIKRVVSLMLCLILVASCTMTAFGATNAKTAKTPKLNKTSVSAYKGDTVNLSVKNAKGKIKWTSSDKKVATVSKKGVVKCKKVGSTIITAKVNSTELTCKVVVNKPKLTKKSVTIIPKSSVALKVKGDKIKSATSSNKKICTVNANGKVTAKKAGRATITLKGSKGKYKCTVNVKTPSMSEDMTVKVGDKQQLDINVDGNKVKWSSANKNIAKVDKNGVVSGVKAGKTKVKAKVGKYTCTCDVVVSDFELTSNVYNVVSGNVNYTYFYISSSEKLTNLVLWDANASTEIGSMYDDGNYSSHGDDMEGDGVYSYKYRLNSNVGSYSFYAKSGNRVSNTVTIKVHDSLSSKDQAMISDVGTKVSSITTGSGFSKKSLAKKKTQVKSALNDLKKQKLIEKYEYNDDAKTYEFTYENGILGAVMLNDFNEKANGEDEISVDDVETEEELAEGEISDDNQVEEVIVADDVVVIDEETDIEEIDEASDAEIISEEVVEDETEEIEASDARVYTKNNILQSLIEDSGENLEGTTESIGTAIILQGFDESWRNSFYNKTVKDWNAKGLSTTYDDEVKVSDLLNVKNYDVAVFSMHGSTYDGDPVLCVNEKPTESTNKTYEKELLGNEIALVNYSDGTSGYWVRPAYFKNHLSASALVNTMIFSESCQFMGAYGNVNYDMSNALTNKDARSVVGFHNSVLAKYSRNVMKDYVDRLIAGDNCGEAFEHATNRYGDGDGQKTDEAYPILRGDSGAYLVGNSFENGSFESGLSSWKSAGDCRAISKLAEITPKHGSRMGIITTGIGASEEKYKGAIEEGGTEGSELKQKFIVPANVSTLSFWYDVVSEEPTEYVNTKYDDQYYARLVDANGNVLKTVASETINTSTWYQIEGIDFDGGDSTVYHTMWKSVSVDVSAYRGQSVTLQFVVFDKGDSIFDTAAIMDNIVLK